MNNIKTSDKMVVAVQNELLLAFIATVSYQWLGKAKTIDELFTEKEIENLKSTVIEEGNFC